MRKSDFIWKIKNHLSQVRIQAPFILKREGDVAGRGRLLGVRNPLFLQLCT